MENQKLENLLNLALASTEEERARSASLNSGYHVLDDTWEVIVKYTGDLGNIRQAAEEVTELFGGFAVLRVKRSVVEELSMLPEVTYVEKPKPLYFALQEAKQASCLTRVQFGQGDLSGRGVLFCCVDSGVDYMHPEFRKSDGTTRILFLWDQTIQGNPPAGYSRGSEYTSAQINEALLAQTSVQARRMVPSVDISGHGTGVLGIGAGNQGVAYESDLIVVKLGNPENRGFPRTTELMEGVDYCVRKSVELSMPAAINLSFGNNYGAHNGTSLLETYLDTVAGVGKNVICTGVGNEGVSAKHAAITIQEKEPQEIEFSIGELEASINLQFWKSYSDEIRILIESPAGEQAGPLDNRLGVQRLRLRDTQLLVYYGTPTPYNVSQEIYIDFLPQGQYLPSGVWKIRIEPIKIVWGLTDLWLPVSESLSSRTGFLTPSVAGSFTVPAPAKNVISVAAYDSREDAYADFSGRAFNVLPWAGKPDLAAPGVDLQVPAAGGGYRTVSGTSFATPFVTGSAALFMEWGIVRENDPFLFGNKMKAYFRRGARQLPGFSQIPNFRIGYGALCVEDSLPKT